LKTSDIIQVVPSIEPAVQWTLAGIVLIAACTDLRARKIPNWLVLVGLGAGFLLNGVLDGSQGLLGALSGMGLALLIYVPLFILRAMGGGDVKLMAAVGCMAGPQNWFSIFIMASLLGGVFAVGLLLTRNAMGGALGNIWRIVKELAHLRLPWKMHPELDIGHRKALTMPHGVAIAAGTLVFLFVR
jgi:prepilin peptidase CpaA